MKKLIAVFLTLALVLSLCACGKSNSATEETEQDASSAASEQPVDYFSEYGIMKPSLLKFKDTEYDEENKTYCYDLPSGTSEALDLCTEYINELQESGVQLYATDKDNHLYLILIDDETVGWIGILVDPIYGSHRMLISFEEKNE